MAEPLPFKRPINWSRLRADEAERVIRERASNTDNVIIGDHAFVRLVERSEIIKLNTEDVYHILLTGMVEGTPELKDNEWKVIVVKRMPGTREAGVVTLFAQVDQVLFVKTVEWMDFLR